MRWYKSIFNYKLRTMFKNSQPQLKIYWFKQKVKVKANSESISLVFDLEVETRKDSPLPLPIMTLLLRFLAENFLLNLAWDWLLSVKIESLCHLQVVNCFFVFTHHDSCTLVNIGSISIYAIAGW